MQITVKDDNDVKKTLHIEIPVETVSRELDDTYRELKKTAKVKGFRPGKTPMPVLKRLFKDKVHADVAFQLIQNTLPNAVMEKQLNIVGEPVINSSELKEDQAFSYDATVEIRPELPDLDFKGFNLKKTAYCCSDEEINAQLSMLRKNLAKQEDLPTPRPAALNDIATINFSGSQNGLPADTFPERDDYRLKIGAGAISKSFDDQIIGMSIGDSKTFEVVFPDDHMDPKVAGQTVEFKVKLVSLKEEIEPALDDELAKTVGPYESLAQLTEAIKANLQSGYDKRSDQELQEQVFEALLSKYSFNIPESMINFELDGILEEIERTYQAYNISLASTGQTRESLAGKYRETAEKQAKRHVLLNKIIEQEKLDISPEEFETGFAEVAGALRQPLDMVKKFYDSNPQQKDALQYSLLEKKAMKTIIDNSHIEEVAPEKSGDDKPGK
jgi:trigger factor